MLLACHKKSYLIWRNIGFPKYYVIFFFKQLSLPCFGSLSFVLQKKFWNRLCEYSKILNFVTYQRTFLLTCQGHEVIFVKRFCFFKLFCLIKYSMFSSKDVETILKTLFHSYLSGNALEILICGCSLYI